MHTLFSSLRRVLLPVLVLLVGGASVALAEPKLGLQCWTFRRYTLEQTLDHAVALNVSALQAYVGQTLGGGLEGTFGPDMTDEQIKTVNAWLKQRQVNFVSIGVTGADDEAGWKKLITFAEKFGIRNITTEVPQELLPTAAKLTKARKMTLSLHNHPTPSRYADPAVALAAVKDLDASVGLCADTGHWTRDARDPVATLKSAAGRINELHFKDISEPLKVGHDMPWGTGIGNAAGQIAELRRQGFDGYCFVEYEHDTATLLSDVARSIGFFRLALKAPLEQLQAQALAPVGYTRDVTALWRDKWASSPGKWPSPTALFAADLANAEMAPGAWAWENGELVSKGKGDLWTKETYGDFALSLEFKCEAGTNSGVFLRTSDIVNWLHNAIEVQISQPVEQNPRHNVGALFDVQAPTREIPITPGTWHRYVIVAQGSLIDVYLDGEQIVKADLNQWTAAGQNPDGTPNKFQKAYRDMAREGRIGLQDHGTPISFRNLLIERI